MSRKQRPVQPSFVKYSDPRLDGGEAYEPATPAVDKSGDGAPKVPGPVKTLKDLIAVLEPLVSLLNGDTIAGPCTVRKPRKTGGTSTCLQREFDYRKADGSTLGFLNFRREQMCDSCLLAYLVDAARVHAYEMESKRVWIEARTKAES